MQVTHITSSNYVLFNYQSIVKPLLSTISPGCNFDSWKQYQFADNSIVHDNYQSKLKDYHLALHKFLNQLEIGRVRKLCVAAKPDEKMFWRLLKGQRSSSKMGPLLVNGCLITEEIDIYDM